MMHTTIIYNHHTLFDIFKQSLDTMLTAVAKLHAVVLQISLRDI